MSAATEHMIARLHMHAVVPCLAALPSLDGGARSLIAGRRFAVRLETRSGLSSRLDCVDGDVRLDSAQPGYPAARLLFVTDRQLNRAFSGSGLAVPIPVGGFVQLFRVGAFSRLSARLRDILLGSPQQAADDDVLRVQTDLLLGTLIPSAVVQLADHDEPCRRWLAPFRGADVQLGVVGGVSSRVHLARGGAMHVAGASGGRPDVLISFRDDHVALAAVRGDLDGLAAIGKGEVTVRGLIPLADALSCVLDRLGYLLGMGR